jgi:hypothetical protein
MSLSGKDATSPTTSENSSPDHAQCCHLGGAHWKGIAEGAQSGAGDHLS